MSFIILIIQQLIQFNPFAASCMHNLSVMEMVEQRPNSVVLYVDPFPAINLVLRKMAGRNVTPTQVAIVGMRVLEALAHYSLLAFRWKTDGRRLSLEFWQKILLPVLPQHIDRPVSTYNIFALARSITDQVLRVTEESNFGNTFSPLLTIFPLDLYDNYSN